MDAAPTRQAGAAPAAGAPARAARVPARSALAALLLLNLFVDGLVALNLRRSWAQRQEQAALSTQNVSRLLERSLDAVFDKVDLALLTVADEHARQAATGRPDGVALDEVLARQKGRNRDLLSLRVVDAHGRVVRGVPASTGQVSVEDRDYFLLQRAGSDAGLAISQPAMGRIIKVPLIFFSRRLTRPDGAFDGIVFATISLEHLASLLAEVEVGPRGATLLRYRDLTAVVRRSSGVTEPFLSPSQASPPLGEQIAAGQSSGVYVAVAPKDGVERTYGWRKVGERPFYVLVGFAQEDVLSTWWREVERAAGLAGLFAMVTALGAWFALRSFRSRLATADALREGEARLAAIFAAFPDGLAISSGETSRYLLVNEGFARMTGWGVDEVVGRTSAELDLFVAGADREALITALESRGAVDELEAVFRRRDGTHLTVLVSGRLLGIEGERYRLTVTRDITRQRQLEAQLRQAQRLESVGRLAGGVAHDFNNMLSVILGEAAILEADLPPGHEARTGVREIVHAAERSRDLTRQLLAFSRKQAISPRAVNLDALVEATRPTLARLIGEDIALVFEPAGDLKAVRLDPSQFDQVLMNLVVNARDAMSGGGRIVLRTANARLAAPAATAPELAGLAPGDYALLTVSDDGQGMDAETLAHLFEPFFTTKAAGKGTGLGLATTYGIVQQSGGAILARSAPGRGATFRIYLPCTQEAPAQAPEPGPRPARGVGTVLLVEDEAPVRRTTRRLLESLGYRVLEAGSGEEALALAQGAAFDLLVTDVVMPGLKGPELSQRLQAARPGLPTLFLSGYAASAMGSQGVLTADTRYLQKPFTVQDLARKVQEAMASRAAPAPASLGSV